MIKRFQLGALGSIRGGVVTRSQNLMRVDHPCYNQLDFLNQESLNEVPQSRIIRVDGHCYDTESLKAWMSYQLRNSDGEIRWPLTNRPMTREEIRDIAPDIFARLGTRLSEDDQRDLEQYERMYNMYEIGGPVDEHMVRRMMFNTESDNPVDWYRITTLPDTMRYLYDDAVRLNQPTYNWDRILEGNRTMSDQLIEQNRDQIRADQERLQGSGFESSMEGIRPGNKPKKRITPMAVSRDENAPVNPAFAGTVEQRMNEELIKRIQDENYGQYVKDIKADSKKYKTTEKWGKKDKKEEKRRKEQAKLTKKQEERMNKIYEKYEKEAMEKANAKALKNLQKKKKSEDLSTILKESTLDTEEFAKKLKSMAPKKSVQPRQSKACEIRGYSKLKKAELVTAVESALRGKFGQDYIEAGPDLKKQTVKKLRALAREFCGYKKRSS